MPEPIERELKVAGLRVLWRHRRRGHFVCVCWKCRRDSIVAAKSLRLKKCGCRHCYPNYRAARPVVVYERGLPSVAA